MAIWTGKHGALKKNNVAVAQTQNWKIDVAGDLGDASSLGADWKTQGALLSSWKGSFDVIFDPGITEHLNIMNAIVAAAGMTMLTDVVFFIDGSGAAKKLSGNLWVVGFSPSAPVGDLIKATFTFTGDGALTFTA